MVQHMQINKLNTTYKHKNENRMIISINTEKSLDKIQHLFIIKVLNKLRIEGTYLSIMKAVYDKPIANIILNREKLKPYPLKSGHSLSQRQGCLLSPL
jgi:hypothetical protein